MQSNRDTEQSSKPLVEVADDETVLRALNQSAHPVEFIESAGPAEGTVSSDERTDRS
jgi:hypothetical protein